MRRARSILLITFGVALPLMLWFATPARAQTGQRITFGASPAIFRAGQPASAELSICNVSMYPLTLSAGSTFSFFVDGSFGVVSSFTMPITVNSSHLLAADFSASLGPSPGQVNITYNGLTKSFVFGDTMSVKVILMASAQAGPGKLSLSSQFVPVVNGNVPFTTVAIVDFANGGTSVVAHDQTLTGGGTVGSPLGISVPLNLSGVASGNGIALLTARNSSTDNHGIEGDGGPGGAGLVGIGGNLNSDIGSGGPGAITLGGDNSSGGFGGDGIIALPGNSSNGKTPGLAGDFQGDIKVDGTITKAGGAFKIDHPINPSDKYLYHSFVESPDMKNIYDGIVELDARGEATVELPEWFGPLNRDFRYQLTCVGGFAPVYIAAKVAHNRFRIAGGLAGMEVSWQITGIRQDAWANAHRIPVEESKSEVERGYYLHPDLFGQSEEKGVEWARHPETMQRLKNSREQTQSHGVRP